MHRLLVLGKQRKMACYPSSPLGIELDNGAFEAQREGRIVCPFARSRRDTSEKNYLLCIVYMGSL